MVVGGRVVCEVVVEVVVEVDVTGVVRVVEEDACKEVLVEVESTPLVSVVELVCEGMVVKMDVD
jgi:hypothetical protein